MINQFSNLSCYEEFEIQCDLAGISKIDILKEIGHKIDDYYFFISTDGIFNWFDLNSNHIKDPSVLKELKNKHIHDDITKCIIPNSVTSIGAWAFSYCDAIKEVIFKGKTLKQVKRMKNYHFGITDESIIKCEM